MEFHLPQSIAQAIQPLFDELPFEQAMEALVVSGRASNVHVRLVECVCEAREVAARPPLQAGLWLYIDELDRSHTISQSIHDATGSFWHGIMHRREGDFSNSHYWFNRVGNHPAMAGIPGYDAHAFVDAVATRHSSAPPELVAMQRDEWAALFAWCAEQYAE